MLVSFVFRHNMITLSKFLLGMSQLLSQLMAVLNATIKGPSISSLSIKDCCMLEWESTAEEDL